MRHCSTWSPSTGTVVTVSGSHGLLTRMASPSYSASRPASRRVVVAQIAFIVVLQGELPTVIVSGGLTARREERFDLGSEGMKMARTLERARAQVWRNLGSFRFWFSWDQESLMVPEEPAPMGSRVCPTANTPVPR